MKKVKLLALLISSIGLTHAISIVPLETSSGISSMGVPTASGGGASSIVTSSYPVVSSIQIGSSLNPSTSASSSVPNSIASSSAPVTLSSIPSALSSGGVSSGLVSGVGLSSAVSVPFSTSADISLSGSLVSTPVASSAGASLSGLPSGSLVSLPLVGLGGWIAGIFTPKKSTPAVTPTDVVQSQNGVNSRLGATDLLAAQKLYF